MENQQNIPVDPNELISRQAQQLGQMHTQVIMQQIAVDNLTAQNAVLMQEIDQLKSAGDRPEPTRAAPTG